MPGLLARGSPCVALEAPRRPEVGQQQEGGGGEGPLHRLGWWGWLLPTSPNATPGFSELEDPIRLSEQTVKSSGFWPADQR